MFNEQTGDTGHLTGLRNKFSSIIVRMIKKKTKIKPDNNIILLNSDEAHIMNGAKVLWFKSSTFVTCTN
jgi:hypothetical protein